MLSVRYANGRLAGTLASLDTVRVAVGSPDTSSIQYAHHTLPGTEPSAENRARWSIRWTAPKGKGDSVLVHVAANAANDDASEFGDDVYTATEKTVIEQE